MTFGAPLFLIAVLAGLIPVLLHLINRQKAKTAPFSTLRFLRISVEKTRRRKHLHDMLLLILRVAGLLLIAVALSQPTLKQFRHLLGVGARSAVVVILDNSASMATLDNGQERWSLATAAAEQVLEGLRTGDSAALLITCGAPGPESDRLYENHETVRQMLAATSVSYGAADLPARLATARSLLAQEDAPNKEIYLITDMQAASWSSMDSKPNSDNAAGKDIPLVIVDLYGAPRPNVGLSQVDIAAPAPVAGAAMQATVELVGDARVAQQRHIELYLDGQKQQTSPTIQIEANRRIKHTLPFTVDTPGLHRGEIRLVGEDACPRDDRLYFAVSLDARIPVAVVRPQDHPIKYLEDSYYLERALAPGVSHEWAIQATAFPAARLATEPLANFAVIFCSNLPAPDPNTAARLREYLQTGGHVVWICGENVIPSEYAQMDEAAGKELLPAPLMAAEDPPPERPDGWRIGWLDEQHPALAPLVEPPSLYQSVLVQRRVRLDEGEGVRVLAKLDDGQPLLATRRIGEGSTTLLTTTAHVDWTNFPLRPIFLPLMTRLTFDLAAPHVAPPQLVAGTPLVVSVLGEPPTVQAEVTHPSGKVERLSTSHADDASLRYLDTHEPGIYPVRLLNARRNKETAYAVNLDPREANPETLSHEELQDRLGDVTAIFSEDPRDVTIALRRLREGEGLWELFLLAVLAVLVAETLVANRRTPESAPPASMPAAGRSVLQRVLTTHATN